MGDGEVVRGVFGVDLIEVNKAYYGESVGDREWAV